MPNIVFATNCSSYCSLPAGWLIIVLGWVLIGGTVACTSPYHQAMREMSRPAPDRVRALMLEAHASHIALEEALERARDKKGKAMDEQTPPVAEHRRMLSVALDRTELRAWERSRRALAVGDILQAAPSAEGDVACTFSGIGAAYERMIDAIERNDAKIAALLTDVRQHLVENNAGQAACDTSLARVPEAVLAQWERVRADNNQVREAINKLLDRIEEGGSEEPTSPSVHGAVPSA